MFPQLIAGPIARYHEIADQLRDRALNVMEPVALALLLLVMMAYLVDGSFNPFLYFRF